MVHTIIPIRSLNSWNTHNRAHRMHNHIRIMQSRFRYTFQIYKRRSKPVKLLSCPRLFSDWVNPNGITYIAKSCLKPSGRRYSPIYKITLCLRHNNAFFQSQSQRICRRQIPRIYQKNLSLFQKWNRSLKHIFMEPCLDTN